MSEILDEHTFDNPYTDLKKDDVLRVFGFPVFTTYARILGVVTLFAGLFLWAKSLGLLGPDLFDQFAANNHKAIIEGCLMIVLTALGVGLWLETSWGYFLWFLASFGVLGIHFLIDDVSLLHYSLASILSISFLLYCAAYLIRLTLKTDWLTKIKMKK